MPPVTGAGGGTLNLTRRPLLIDRLDWIGGWPVVRGPSPPDRCSAARATLWLRVLYRDGVARMASSRDGATWDWGGAWTLARPAAL